MATQKKIATVSLLSEKISRAKAMVFVDYRGLKHKQMEELRKLLKNVGAEFTVAKNRLMKRALGKEVKFTDTTATLFAYADEVSPIKELLKFFKTAGAGKPKAGILGTSVLSEADVTRLAALPTRNVLLAQLVGQLRAPIQGFHYALSWNINKFVWALGAVKEKKTT
ncbi:50S ribosomal protein L10 [Candidatus Gottesmanbacteria bacterium]|nr:50S ribosomal protein L10 [Candidatus Gottesmanbacteria bacterium]